MLTLYLNWNAVCAQKVLLTLEEKNIAYTLVHIDLAKFEQHDPAYLKLNPAGVVPTLVHDQQVVVESSVIIEYLEDAFPDARLRPPAPSQRAQMRWWMKTVDDTVHGSLRPLSFVRFAQSYAQTLSDDTLREITARMPKKDLAEIWQRVARSPYSDDELSVYLHKVEDVLDRMDQALAQDKWLAGDEFSLADIAMTPYFRRMVQLDKQVLWQGVRPHVADWVKRIEARPSFAVLDRVKQMFGPQS
ncbi:glutathione S-transferase [Rhodospirillales bacterium TMPK1]|uniref:Glutathione S-transferase n=1 Tax=Roseiterribacter gracilis TaxID=2812848 RepID=A0A8S8X661_9PROT|nr:glutathione S-transferase [Rhodospirillales bacterium TMPK1]